MKTIAEKMFVNKAASVAVINAKGRAPELVAAMPQDRLVGGGQQADFVLVFAGSQQELEEVLPQAKTRLSPKGALWVAYVKGTSKHKSDVHRDTIAAYAESIGLDAVSIVSVDDDWSALRLKHSE